MAIEHLVDVMDLCGLTGPSWAAWRIVGKVMDAQPLDRDEQRVFEACTHRSRVPTERPAEVWVVKGRRAGGSRFAGCAATRAAVRRYPLAPGETAVVALAAADKDQARLLLSYAVAPFQTADLAPLVAKRSGWSSALRALVDRETRWGLDTRLGTTIEVRSSHYGRIRGRTFAFVAASEVNYWQAEDGSNPASAVIAAVLPGLATLNGQLLVESTPHIKDGPAWRAYTRYFGKDDDRVLVWQAPTRTMNSTIPERVVQEAMERDPESAKSEWLALFRDDLSALVTDAALRAVVEVGRGVLAPQPGLAYVCFVDPATGSGSDSMTMALAHREVRRGVPVAVVDRVGETRPPFDPADVVLGMAEHCRAYGVDRVHGDGFAKGWTGALFERAGLRYEVSPLTKSEIYLSALSLINSKMVALPDEPRLLAQIAGLQRRPTAAGRESVDHAARTGARDDVANSALGAAVIVGALRPPLRIWGSEVLVPSVDELQRETNEELQAAAQASASEIEHAVKTFGIWFPGDDFGSGVEPDPSARLPRLPRRPLERG